MRRRATEGAGPAVMPGSGVFRPPATLQNASAMRDRLFLTRVAQRGRPGGRVLTP